MKDNNYLGTQKYDHWLWHWPKHKIAILFHFYNLKMQIIMVLLLFICRKQFSLFLHCFSVLNKSKRWQFCVLVNAWTHGHIFNVTKSFRIFLDPIFGHPVYRFPQNLNFLILLSVDLDSHGVTGYENMCHYAWRICIFWPLHWGTVYIVQYSTIQYAPPSGMRYAINLPTDPAGALAVYFKNAASAQTSYVC